MFDLQCLQFWQMLVARRLIRCLGVTSEKMLSCGKMKTERFKVMNLSCHFCTIYTSGSSQVQQSQKQKHSVGSTSFIAITQIPNAMIQDFHNNSNKYQDIRNSFLYHLSKGHFDSNNQNQLIDCLYRFTLYPSIQLDNQQLLSIYSLLCHNLHLKTVEQLNKALLFALKADPNVSQSPIYHEFIKFYLQTTSEEYKVKYELEFESLSVVEAFKQLLARVMQRGFFPRSPAYSRNLNIIYPQKILYLLASRAQTRDALMIKKLTYGIFMDIKNYYESEMIENLYNYRKVFLMNKFTEQLMQVLSMELPQCHNELTHLRQLYMKLYLSLPSYQEDMQYNYDGINELNVKRELEKLKFKNVIYLYRLAFLHIERMNHLELDDIQEDIGVIIEFVQQVENNFKYLAHQEKTIQVIVQISNPIEKFHIMTLLNNFQLQQSSLYLQLISTIKQTFNAYSLNCYFSFVLELILRHSICQLIPIFNSPLQFQYLNLQKLHSLSQIIEKTSDKNSIQAFATLYGNIIVAVLNLDYEIIGGREILFLIQIYTKHLILKQNTGVEQRVEDHAQTLRIFVMRYLADHHKQFPVGQLQVIVETLLQLPLWVTDHFDDHQGNYPKEIFQQMQQYLSQVMLMFKVSTRQQLVVKNKTSTFHV